MKKLMLLILLIPSFYSISANEKINSLVDEYYTALSLDGEAYKSSLTYNSFSFNRWTSENTLFAWKEYLTNDRSIWGNENISLLLLDPEIFFSGSSSYARTELNDGALWQGRGMNAILTTGIEFSSKYIDIIYYPEFWIAQNQFYQVVTPDPGQANQDVGYFFNGIDYPQRMGGNALWNYNWGQSGFHLNIWKLTLGFSHENIKSGPSIINPLLLSNNASGFWHMNFGLKNTETKIGNFEWQFFWGQLNESDFFDSNENNDNTFISGMLFAYAPQFIPGLTLGLNRTLASNWEDLNGDIFFKIFNPIFFNTSYGRDVVDQRASLTLEWQFPTVGFKFYGELFFEDYSTNIKTFILVPEHATAYTLGMMKSYPVRSGKLITIFEISQLIQSRDYEVGLGTGGTYYTHHIVNHGHTNEGQILGAGIGPGSDSKTFLVDWYSNWGKIGLKLQRIGWHKDYIYRDPSDTNDPDGPDQGRLQVEMNYGINCTWILSPLELSTELMYSTFYNRNFVEGSVNHNVYGNIKLKYRY